MLSMLLGNGKYLFYVLVVGILHFIMLMFVLMFILANNSFFDSSYKFP
jgi:hypothetical protein